MYSTNVEELYSDVFKIIFLMCKKYLKLSCFLCSGNLTSSQCALNIQHLSKPERFSGNSDNCVVFLFQCELHFEFQAATFPPDWAKIAYIISYLTGRAEAWTTAEWSHKSSVCSSLAQIFRFSLLTWNPTSNRSAEIVKWKSMSFILPPIHSWASSFHLDAFAWTLKRLVLYPNGQYLLRAKPCRCET